MLCLLQICVFPVATYGCEAWTLNKTVAKRITSFELKCYRRVLRIPWTARKTNQEVLRTINVQEGWLLNTILKKKLAFFGHIKRHNGMERVLLEGMIEGNRGKGRPRRRWTKDIQKCLRMSLEEAEQLAQDRGEFKRSIGKTTFWKEYVT